MSEVLQYAVACHQAGILSEAEKGYRKVLKRHPRHFDCLHLLGVISFQRGDYREALRQIDVALKIEPNAAVAHGNRAAALQGLKRFDEALASCNKATALKPDYAEAFNTRGAVLIELKQLEEAIASCDRAIALRPDYVEAISNRGNAFKDLKHRADALENYDRALSINPDFADAHNNRANVLNQLERFDEALASAKRAIALKPDLPEAYLNLGTAYFGLKRHGDAVAAYDQVMARNPEIENLLGLHLHAKMFACLWTDFELERSRLVDAVESGRSATSPFPLLPCSTDPAMQLKCAEKASSRYSTSLPPLWRGDIYSHSRIRVAYLSADFCDHAVSIQTVGMFERHDRLRFETTAISYGADELSPIRDRLKGAFDRFIDARTMTDDEVAKLIRDLEIDIVVDLNGYTDGSRPEVLVQRPAPVHVNYLGYPGTLGHACWDYIIADRFVIPEASQAYYGEEVVCLPDCYMATDSTRKISSRMPSRAEVGLPENGLVFCCFNNSYKITPDIFDVWMRLLKEIEDSVLWLSIGSASAVGNLRREAEARGIAAERLVFAPRVPLNEDHLARMRLADLFLDTLYYNAHSTAADALWVGVPVLTCAGKAFASRVAGSLLQAVGLPELVTHSLADYEALALRLARDRPLLSSLREKLTRNRDTHPLFDTERFTRGVEAAYKTMWERTQRGEKPHSFAVAPSEGQSATTEAPALGLSMSDFRAGDRGPQTKESPMANSVIPPTKLPPEGIKLHIGGQERREGWKILDALPGPIVDYVGNCNDLSFLPDESCSEVYASHVFEHLGYNGELQNTLQGIYRVLKPGGRLRASVPDLDTLCQLFVDPSLDFAGRFHVMRIMFGGRTTEYDVHFVGLNFELLATYLHQVGFRDIRRVQGFGVFNDTSSLVFAGVPISLNVEALK